MTERQEPAKTTDGGGQQGVIWEMSIETVRHTPHIDPGRPRGKSREGVAAMRRIAASVWASAVVVACLWVLAPVAGQEKRASETPPAGPIQ